MNEKKAQKSLFGLTLKPLNVMEVPNFEGEYEQEDATSPERPLSEYFVLLRMPAC